MSHDSVNHALVLEMEHFYKSGGQSFHQSDPSEKSDPAGWVNISISRVDV